MVIHYFGDGCFRLQNGDVSLLVNPASNRLKADVTLKTLTMTNVATPLPDEISFPGEYEVKDIEIQGWPVTNESTDKFLKTVFLVTWDEMRFLFLGHLSKPLEAELVEEVGEPDVLFVPTGDPHFLPPADAAKLVKQLEPSLVIPAFAKNANELVKAMGQKAEESSKLVFKKKDLAAKKRALVILTPGT